MNSVQITSGDYKRRRIKTPGEGTHPMGERERLALFKMISGYLPGATVIDAYAGSGALGIEALSRGAKKVLFIEKSPKAMQIIKENCALLGVEKEKIEFYRGSVNSFCEEPKNARNNKISFKKVEMILADPPYDNFDAREIESLALFLKPDGLLVLSHPGEAPKLSKLKLLKTQSYASAHLSIYNLVN